MHHNSTPASILEAPTQTVKFIHENSGPNRYERRHGYTHDTGKHFIVPKQYREEATNVPYIKPKKETK